MVNSQTELDIALLSTKDGSRLTIVKTPFNEFGAQFSPDGRWLAYTSAESGRPEVYVRSVQPGGGRWQVSVDGGRDARWTPDGQAIVFSLRREVFRAKVGKGRDSLDIGVPARLFEMPRLADPFDIAPDGSFVGVLVPEGVTGATELQYVENWFADLERRVPRP